MRLVHRALKAAAKTTYLAGVVHSFQSMVHAHMYYTPCQVEFGVRALNAMTWCGSTWATVGLLRRELSPFYRRYFVRGHRTMELCGLYKGHNDTIPGGHP